MKHFTLNSHSWTTLVLGILFFAVAGVAKAVEFGAAPTKFISSTLNGTYEVVFEDIASTNIPVGIVNMSDYEIVDASGQKVPFAFVVPEMKGDFAASFTVGGADQAPAGVYTIKVPQGAFQMIGVPREILSDAFDITIDCSGNGEVDPGTEEEYVNPGAADNVATFVFDDHTSSASIYYKTDDFLSSNAKGVFLSFDRVGMESDTYSYTYKSGSGFIQLKDCEFTISAPLGSNIVKVEFVNAAPQSYLYALENISGAEEGIWTGSSNEVKFSLAGVETPIYDVQEIDGEDVEVIVGYTTTALAVHVSRIYVTLDCNVNKIGTDGICSVVSEAEQSGIYDLAGRRTIAAEKGFFIVGGKKVIR